MIKSLKDGVYEYRECDKVGQGAFAKVYKGYISAQKQIVAIRILSLQLVKQYGAKIKEFINDEVRVLKELSQCNDIDYYFTTRIFDCFLTQHNVVMILEFCPDGNLQDLMKKGGIKQEYALPIIYQLARGLSFISRKNIVHRDLKPDNVFLKKEDGHTLYKLGDFGFAVKKQLNKQTVGTPIFMSPEIWRQESYGSEVDVWAFGIIVYYILFKQYYFMGFSQPQIKAKVLNENYKLCDKYKQKISPGLSNFIQGCLQKDKKYRTSAQKISQHYVFDKVKNPTEKMILEIQTKNRLFQSRIRADKPKVALANLLMKYNFIFQLACFFKSKQKENLASLYMFKYNILQLQNLNNQLQKKINVINHSQWYQFSNSDEYIKLLEVSNKTYTSNLQNYQDLQKKVINKFTSHYGTQTAIGIKSNLEPKKKQILPNMIIHELKNKWMPQLEKQKLKENYLKNLQSVVVICILENKKIKLNFYEINITKSIDSYQSRCKLLENAIQQCK